MFINRTTELQLLEERYRSAQAEFFVLYGRRRVGKTELRTQFCHQKRHIFFVADLDVEPTLRAAFSAAVNAELFGPETTHAVYDSWEALLLLLAKHAQTERIVVVLDEFTYLTDAHPPFASILQRLWDNTLVRSRLMLILCGSYVGMIEKNVLGYNAPLYGRRTGQYLLEPLEFADARHFFTTYDRVDQVRAYAIFGGSPAYLRSLLPTQSLLENLRQQVLTRGTFLYDEVRFLLQQELRDPRVFFAVLEAIAAGRTRQNEISQATGITGVSSYLETLLGLRLIERTIPATENQPHKSRRGLYRLSDQFFRFWFRFVHPHRTLLERGGSEIATNTLIAPYLDQFTGPVFEEICRQFLWRLGLAGQLPFVPLRIGGWWRANEEVDLVAIGEKNALVAECKWSQNPIGLDILHNLERKTTLVRTELPDCKIYYGLCARTGFTPQLQVEAERRGDLFLYDLPLIVESLP